MKPGALVRAVLAVLMAVVGNPAGRSDEKSF